MPDDYAGKNGHPHSVGIVYDFGCSRPKESMGQSPRIGAEHGPIGVAECRIPGEGMDRGDERLKYAERTEKAEHEEDRQDAVSQRCWR